MNLVADPEIRDSSWLGIISKLPPIDTVSVATLFPIPTFPSPRVSISGDPAFVFTPNIIESEEDASLGSDFTTKSEPKTAFPLLSISKAVSSFASAA